MADLLPGMIRYLVAKSVPSVFMLSLGIFLGDPAISLQALFCTRWTYVLGSLYFVASFLYGRLVPHRRSDVYSLDHGMLNLQLPVRHMWMNLGYWDVSPIRKGDEDKPWHGADADLICRPSHSRTHVRTFCEKSCFKPASSSLMRPGPTS